MITIEGRAMVKSAFTVFTFTVVSLGTCRVCGAADAEGDAYDVLYDTIMTRHSADGRTFGENEITPLTYIGSEFPFDAKTYEQFRAALEAFDALPPEKIAAYSSVKRALLQRHLWAVFDHATQRLKPLGRPQLKVQLRQGRKTLARLIKRLALSKAEILALPDVRTATVESGEFAEEYATEHPFRPFFPADLYASESSWVCLGSSRKPVPAIVHSRFFKWRSAFIAFIRLPGGREDTLAYLDQLNRGVSIPEDTQFALIEQAFLISDEGELVLSPLVTDIQLRAQVARKQSVAEFVIQPRQLMQGHAAMRAVGPEERRYKTLLMQRDRFDSKRLLRIRPRLERCSQCHGGPNIHSINSRTSRFTREQPVAVFKEGNPAQIARATAARKQEDDSWQDLQEIWQAARDN